MAPPASATSLCRKRDRARHHQMRSPHRQGKLRAKPIQRIERISWDYPYGYLVIALSVVLKIRRTLTGQEVKRVIADTHARFELAAERRRRANWRKRELAASRFRAECDHCRGLGQIGCGSRQHQ